MGSAWGCDGKTAKKFLGKFRDDGRINLSECSTAGITIEICNYQYYQSITAKELTIQRGLDQGQSGENSGKNPSKPDQSRAKQTKAKRAAGKNPDHQTVVDYWYRKYRDHVGAKYDFKGKDWGNFKRLLNVWGADQMIQLIDQLFISRDSFIQKAGYKIGTLSAMSNDLMQEIMQVSKATLPERTLNNLKAAEAYLNKGNDEQGRQEQVGAGAKQIGTGTPKRS